MLCLQAEDKKTTSYVRPQAPDLGLQGKYVVGVGVRFVQV